MTLSMTPAEKKAVDTIRTLSMDAVQAANSGHPGTPMALAPLGYLLFNEVMRFDPADPAWPGRDRFVLSVGHASMLIYALLHLSGVKQLDKNTDYGLKIIGVANLSQMFSALKTVKQK